MARHLRPYSLDKVLPLCCYESEVRGTSATGQKRRIECVSATSVLPPKADVRLPRNDRRNGPILLKNSPVETVKAH